MPRRPSGKQDVWVSLTPTEHDVIRLIAEKEAIRTGVRPPATAPNVIRRAMRILAASEFSDADIPAGVFADVAQGRPATRSKIT